MDRRPVTQLGTASLGSFFVRRFRHAAAGAACALIGADVTRHDTNMLFVRVGEEQAPALGKFMQAQG